jgi:hypothetical protein
MQKVLRFGLACGVLAAAAGMSPACVFSVGPCWVEGDEDPDRHPIECDDTHQSPCEKTCFWSYAWADDACAKLKDGSQRAACQDKEYVSYNACLSTCAAAETCNDRYEACKIDGAVCSAEVGGGRTLCGICLDDCIAKRPYSFGACGACGFD